MQPVENRRDSGIAIVGDLPWGSHFCQFYRTREDVLNVLVPYFIAGLKNDEACVWVTSEFLSTQDAMNTMKERVSGFSEYLSKGQIEIFPYTDWYLKGGKFDLRRTLDMWIAKHDQAVSRGYAGLRVSGDPYWITNKTEWDDFAEYEAEINRVISGTKLIVLCTYSLAKCSVVEIIDVIKKHEFALAMNYGEWQLVRMPGFSRANEP